MSKTNPPSIGPFGKYVIFSGAGMAFMALSLYALKPLERAFGEKALPYVILGIAAAIILIDRYFYRRFPQRIVISVGIVGWLVTFLLLLLRNAF